MYTVYTHVGAASVKVPLWIFTSRVSTDWGRDDLFENQLS